MPNKTTYRTRAQEELLSFLKKNPGTHHTASQIRDHFAAEPHPIGMATIYRHLERFVKDGSVRKYVLGPGDQACYAYMEDEGCASHFHCICEECGRLIHLDCEKLQQLRSHLLSEHGFAINSGKTVFYGTCSGCLGKTR